MNEILEQIRTAESLTALWQLMVRYYRELGFGAVAYLLFDGGQVGKAIAFLEHGFPPESVAAYADLGYGKHDPTLRVVMASGQPDMPNRIAKRIKLSPAELMHRSIIQGFGAGESLNLPLFGPHGRNACGMLGRASDPRLFDEANWPRLHMVAQAAHLRAFAFQRRMPLQHHDLSQREIEILRWVAQGKSNAVIADILSLSASTVDTYLRRVFEKLDVADRTSAAVKGVSMGLIRA